MPYHVVTTCQQFNPIVQKIWSSVNTTCQQLVNSQLCLQFLRFYWCVCIVYFQVLGKDIYPQLKETKLTTLDHIYADNIQAGRNKYNTLKRIRMGNTKQRVDQFECM